MVEAGLTSVKAEHERWLPSVGVRSGIATFLVGGLCVLVLSGCSGSCTQIGAQSGVIVEIARQLQPAPVSSKVCVQDRCEVVPQPAFGVGGVPAFVLPTSNVSGSDPVRITVAFYDSQSKVIAGADTVVSPVKVQPNGEGCGPTAWQATITATAVAESVSSK